MGTRMLAQHRAEDALRKVRSLEQCDEGLQTRYVSYVASLPAAIITNGLGQACATLLAAAKGKLQDPHRILYENLQSWLCRDATDAPYGPGDLMHNITTQSRGMYLRAQVEALEWLEWHKKLATAYLRKASSAKVGKV